MRMESKGTGSAAGNAGIKKKMTELRFRNYTKGTIQGERMN